MHGHVLHNDDILDAHARSISAGQVGFLNGWGVFSTLRVADGILFAYERHWKRMQRDARKLHVPFPESESWLQARLYELVEANNVHDGTLRLAIVRNRGGAFEGPDVQRDFDLIGFTTDLNKWGNSVRLGIKPQARHAQCEFTGTKVLSWAWNLTWYEEAHDRGFDEYILLNERGEMSECTSANIFVVHGSEICTPPLTSGCLAGITRELLLEEIKIEGYTISERALAPAELDSADQVFITSSTRDVLPVTEVEGHTVRSKGAVTATLLSAFSDYRKRYVQESAKRLQAVQV